MNSTTALPVLYSFRRCPFAIRARLALAVSGQVCELREVVLRNKPQALLQASPKATVPVLVLQGGRVLEQSLDIMLWALQQRDPEGWLTPGEGDLEDMLALIAECDGPFKHALDRCKYPSRYPEANAEQARAQAVLWLQQLDGRLGRHRYLFGHRPALVDMAIAPFVRQFAGIDAAWWDAQPWTRLQAWLAQWQAGPLFESVMHKLPPWADGTLGARFPHDEGGNLLVVKIAALSAEVRASHPATGV